MIHVSSRMSRRFMRHGVQPPAFKFSVEAQWCRRRKLPKSEAGCSASISAVSDRVAMHHGVSTENDTCKRCVGCLRSFLRRGVSAAMPSLHPGRNAKAYAPFCRRIYFSPLSLRRISAQAIMPRRSRRRYSPLPCISDGVA